jgi:hypothetical protein
MKLPQKVYDAILAEAIKNVRFSWYSGWEKSSGYIKSELFGHDRYNSVRIYVEWKKKKEPTDIEMKKALENWIDEALENKKHHSKQRDFAHYITSNYYVDVRRLEYEIIKSIQQNLSDVLKAIETYENFELPRIQELFNDLKNFECAISDHEAVSSFIEHGEKRIGE